MNTNNSLKTKWDLKDDDCCQYTRMTDYTMQMIEIISLDYTSEDLEDDENPYIVVMGEVDYNDIDEEEKDFLLSVYGYNTEQFYGEYSEDLQIELFCEMSLEESIMCNNCIIAEFNTFESAQKFITQYIISK